MVKYLGVLKQVNHGIPYTRYEKPWSIIFVMVIPWYTFLYSFKHCFKNILHFVAYLFQDHSHTVFDLLSVHALISIHPVFNQQDP